MPGVIVVLVVESGAGWEQQALALLNADAGIVVLKRCVDVDDLMAAASTGQAEVAVLSADLPGLDRVVVDHLAAHGVALVGVTQDPSTTRVRAARVGLEALVAVDRLADLPAAVREPASATRPAIDVPQEPEAIIPAPAGRGGRVIVVWGPTGAPGRTTLAVGLAAQLARRGLSTVLIDADPYGGSVAQHLGVLDEVSGLLVASRLASSGTLSDKYADVPRRLSDRLHLVTGLPRPDRWREVRPGTLEELVGRARHGAEVVIDTGFDLEPDPYADPGVRPERNGLTFEALGLADEIVVVGSADPVGLARLARAVRDLGEHLDRSSAGPSRATVRVAVNRMRPSLGWREADVASMLTGFGAPPDIRFLPDDQPAVDRALVAGRSLVESGESALSKAMAGLLDAMAGLALSR
jgi:MinD-like ATPase involved in chromosome partitioning or flagellar assembly